MMTLTVKQMAIIKRTAQSVAPYTNKKAKLQDKIIEAAKQIHEIESQMEDFQVPVRNMTSGLTTEDIVRKVIVNGAAKYEPNPEVVRFNESTRVYEFIEDTQEPTSEVTEQENEAIEASVEERATESPVNPFED